MEELEDGDGDEFQGFMLEMVPVSWEY